MIGTAELLSIISSVSFILCGVFLVLAVVLFFVFGIPSIVGDLTGKTAKRSIDKIRANNEKNGSKGYYPSPANSKRGKITDTMKTTGKDSGGIAKGGQMAEKQQRREQVQPNYAAPPAKPVVTPARDTTVPIMPNSEGTTPLYQEVGDTQGMQGNANNRTGKTERMEQPGQVTELLMDNDAPESVMPTVDASRAPMESGGTEILGVPDAPEAIFPAADASRAPMESGGTEILGVPDAPEAIFPAADASRAPMESGGTEILGVPDAPEAIIPTADASRAVEGSGETVLLKDGQPSLEPGTELLNEESTQTNVLTPDQLNGNTSAVPVRRGVKLTMLDEVIITDTNEAI